MNCVIQKVVLDPKICFVLYNSKHVI